MTTKKFANKKLQKEATLHEPKNPSGTKMIKRAKRHNLDGTKQFSLITTTFNTIKRNKI